MAATTRSKEIVKQALRELAQEEGATLGQVLSWAGGVPGADLITAGGASGGVQVLGPFTIDFDDQDLLVYPGVPFVAVTVDTWVLDIWVQVTTPFFGDTSTRVDLGVASDGPEGADLVGGWDVQNVGTEHVVADSDFAYRPSSATSADRKLTAARTADGTIRTVPARALVGCNLCAWALPDDGGLTQGQAVLWALVG